MKKYWGSEDQSEEPKQEVMVEKPSVLESIGNRIYFYSDITTSSILKLNQSITDLAHTHIASQMNRAQKVPDTIFLHINSFGGGIFAGLAGLDTITRIKQTVPITTIVDGCCASAGTFLSVAGTERIINKNSFMLIHQLSSIMWGKYAEFQDELQNLDRLMETIKSIYVKYTNVPEKKLDEILKHDLWFDAKMCLEYGLVDKII